MIERLEGSSGLIDPRRPLSVPGAVPGTFPTACAERVPLGIEAVDTVLRGGLRRNGLHEVAAADESAAATGFCAALLTRLAGARGTVVWCRRGAGLYGPGLAGLGLDPARLIVVRARSETDVLWAMEEGLRSRAPAAVLGETAGGGPIALRRLQLAAETGGVSAILLRPAGVPLVPGPALTRWRVGSGSMTVDDFRPPSESNHANSRASMTVDDFRPPSESDHANSRASMTVDDFRPPSESNHADSRVSMTVGDPLRPRWRVALERCRGGGLPASWLVEWCDETGGFVVASDFRHGSARPARPAAPPAAAGRLSAAR